MSYFIICSFTLVYIKQNFVNNSILKMVRYLETA